MYAEEEFSVFASNLGLDTACMSGIIKIMEYVDFCSYGKDFLMGKIDDNRYYSKAHTVRVTIAAIALAELIWQVSLKNINIEKYLVDVLKDNKDREMVIPPRTTGVGRGFPTFRAGSSIIYRSSMNLVPLSAERRTTSMSTIDRCGGIAATDRNFCLFRDTRSLTDSGSY